MPVRFSKTLFAAKRVDDDYVIDVFDFIGADWFGEGITGKSIARSLASAGDAKRILIRMNSPGGDVWEGTTIYNLLLGAKTSAKVVVEIHGLAASMASIVALAGDEVHMAEGSMYMIHNPWSFSIGESDDMKKAANMLDKVKSNMLDIYVKRSNLSRDAISAMMDDETWMTPTEAVKNGFVDKVIDLASDAVATANGDRTFATLSRYTKTPAQLLEEWKGPDGLRLVAVMTSPQPAPKEKKATMDRELLIAALGLKPDATDTEILAASALAAEARTLREENAKLAEAKAKTEKESFEREVNSAVDAAVRDGKIPPSAAQYHRKAAMKGADALAEFKEFAASQPTVAGDEQMKEAERVRGGSVPKTSASTDEEKKMCRLLGVTPEQLAEARADIRADEETYNPEAYRFAM